MKNSKRGFVQIAVIILIVLVIAGGVYYIVSKNKKARQDLAENATSTDSNGNTTSSSTEVLGTTNSISGSKVVTQAQLLAMADNKYADGNLPLGDNKYTTSGPQKGYVYLCNARKDNPGSMVNGPWISGSIWNYLKKVSVGGSVTWPTANFSNAVAELSRKIGGNGLPINHTTGMFPVQSSDPASKYDPNPNTIKGQNVFLTLPLTPTYSATPNCMGGEVGVMLSGVPLFNAFDAGLRDAAAHEEQDACDAHPQGDGIYHYHSLSNCFKDINVTTVLGYALDGFPITGPKVADKKYLTTEDLDVCHGLTSEINLDGKKKIIYHYVMTRDFPYSASCFRGKPVRMQVIPSISRPASATTEAGTPPPQAIFACTNKTTGSSCIFGSPQGNISGSCQRPPNSTQLACVPR
jgi:hypothetical protein